MQCSIDCNNGFIPLPVDLNENFLSNIPLEELPRYACVCKLWSEFVGKRQPESLCKIIEAFPQEIVDVFGGVAKIANFPKMPKIENHRIYYSENVSPCKMTFPVMRGIDEIGQLFISIKYKNERGVIKTATLVKENTGFWEVYTYYPDDAFFFEKDPNRKYSIISRGDNYALNIKYDVLKELVQKGKTRAEGSNRGRRYYTTIELWQMPKINDSKK